MLVRGTKVQVQDESDTWYVGCVVCAPYSIGKDEDIKDVARFGTSRDRVVCRYEVCAFAH